MKVTCHGNQTEQIKQGIEPWDTCEVEVNLSLLTPEQREILTKDPYITIVEATHEAVACWLSERVQEEEKRKADKERIRAEMVADAERMIVNPPPLQERQLTEYGVPYTDYSVPYSVPYLRGNLNLYDMPEGIKKRFESLEHDLAIEAKSKTEASKQAVQAQIDAAKAEQETKEAEEKKAKEETLKVLLARRLETGKIEIPWTRNDRKEWGEPWIAKLSSRNGKRPEYDFLGGSYDAATETLSIDCKPGEIVAYGQKNYRKPKRTIHQIRKMEADGRLVEA